MSSFYLPTPHQHSEKKLKHSKCIPIHINTAIVHLYLWCKVCVSNELLQWQRAAASVLRFAEISIENQFRSEILCHHHRTCYHLPSASHCWMLLSPQIHWVPTAACPHTTPSSHQGDITSQGDNEGAGAGHHLAAVLPPARFPLLHAQNILLQKVK